MKLFQAFPAILGVGFSVLTFSMLDAAPPRSDASRALVPDAPPASWRAASSTPEDVEAGKALYAKFCQKCHGAQGEGVPRMYQLVEAKIVHLGSKQPQSKSDAEIKKSMIEGVGKMEAVEDLTPTQADKIVAFVRSLKLDEAKR